MNSKQNKKITRGDLKSECWHAADIMRRDDGTNGINEYIEQISWMFFLKVFEDLEKRFENNAALSGHSYSRIIKKEFIWSVWTQTNSRTIIEFVDEKLFPYLSSLSGTPVKNIISLIFTKIKKNKMESAANFKDVIEIFDKSDFNNPDDSHTLSQFYEDMLLKLGKESGIAGEFYTPRPIVKLMVKMVNPKIQSNDGKYSRILDPFCGSCGFIVEAFNHMRKKKISGKDLENIQKRSFHGLEKKSLAFLVGMMNCVLHELLTPNVIRKNTLNQNILNFGFDDKFDYVMTNPPFGGKEGKGVQNNFPVKIGKTELLALQHVMRRLNENGECAIVVPEPILWRGKKYLIVRKDLLENYNIHTIISLPAGVFANVTASGLGPKTNLLFFNKKGTTKEIWYYELTPLKKKQYSKTNVITDEDVEDCFNKWKKREISKNSWIIKKEDINEKCDLTADNPNLTLGFKTLDPQKVINSILELETKISERLQNISKIVSDEERLKLDFKNWDVMPLKNCLQENGGYQSGFACSKKYEQDAGVIHLRPFNITNYGILDFNKVTYLPEEMINTKIYGLKKDDVIFNNTNSKELVGKSAIVSEDLTCGFSNHLSRLRVNTNILKPEWLVLILRFNWLSSVFLRKSRKWIGQAGMNEENILETEILVPDISIQDQIITDYKNSKTQFEEIDELVSTLEESFQSLRISTLKYLIKNTA